MHVLNKELTDIISFVGAIQGILLSFFFLVRKKNHLSNLMIGLYTLVFSAGLLENWIARSFSGYAKVIFQSLLGNSSFLYGPLLYLFVHFFITNDPRFGSKKFIHFLLFFLSLALQLTLVIAGIQISTSLSEVLELVQFEMLMVQILTYNFLAIKKLSNHHEAIVSTYSNLGNKDLNWLKSLLILITSIYILSFALSHLLMFGVSGAKSLFIVVQLGITVSIYLMTYRVIFQPGSFNFAVPVLPEPETTASETSSSSEPAMVSKYQKSGLKSEQASQYMAALQNLMKYEKPYLNPELNIFSLAQLLSVSKKSPYPGNQ